MRNHNYATINDQKIFYREAGLANAQAILLLHGFPSSSHMFRDLIPKLTGAFRVIAPDYLGFGYSDQPGAREYRYTFDNLAGLTETLLFEELRLNSFAIFVQDYGAPVGFRIASRHPEVTWVLIEEVKSGAWGIGGKASGLPDLREIQQSAPAGQQPRSMRAPRNANNIGDKP